MNLRPFLWIGGGLLAFGAPFAVTDYRDAASRLIGAALTDDAGLARLEYLCDQIGNRVSGSPALERALDWAEGQMNRAGLENVRRIPVKVPHWVRGRESLDMLEPLARPVVMLGLGDSIGTPPQGIEADVVVVADFSELNKLGRDKLAGKIVLYNAPFITYGETAIYRREGASRAAAFGAVAVLVRSITPFSMRSPHTGSLRYADGAPKIPAAAVSIEDAMSMGRLAQRGVKIRVKLNMEARMEADALSADVMGEIRGREKPGEVVVLGGHIDSWDVGQGAHDDGAGIMAAMQAVVLMKQLNLRPRRTVRVVFWTNEENGGNGGKAYRDWLGANVSSHVAAIEMDGGAERPLGFGFGPETGAPPAQFSRAQEIVRLLEGIGAGEIQKDGGDSDTDPLAKAGVPNFGLRTVGKHYFDWHHTQADTFDKIDPRDFRLNVASLAVLSYTLAEMPDRLSDLK
jgi:carboxypeptidase Q